MEHIEHERLAYRVEQVPWQPQSTCHPWRGQKQHQHRWSLAVSSAGDKLKTTLVPASQAAVTSSEVEIYGSVL
jgi:hypothetical protein